MRIFVDIGAHYGETLDVALDPRWNFDRIIALEPAALCQPVLASFRDPRLEIHPIGLGRTSERAPLYGAGLLGGTLFRNKPQKARAEFIETEEVQLSRASDWFCRNIPQGAQVFMKFNCEGAECDILDDLIEAGLADRLTSLYIDFDIRKIENQRHRQAETERQLILQSMSYETSDTLDCSGNLAVKKWLAKHCPRVRPKVVNALRFRLGLYAPLYTRLSGLAGRLLPRKAYFWLGRRIGRVARKRFRGS